MQVTGKGKSRWLKSVRNGGWIVLLAVSLSCGGLRLKVVEGWLVLHGL